MLKDVVTVEDVLNSPMISDPLHRMDCCVVSDGGGLCSNHPVNRGGMTKIIEAVRQLRGEAHPKVQVKNCDLAIAHGTGGLLGVRHAASTAILERV
jgi:acetyl-CoA acetyltransferase